MTTPSFITLSEYLNQHCQHQPELAAVLLDTAATCIDIARSLRSANISGLHGVHGDINIQGEDQKKLDVHSNNLFMAMMRRQSTIAAMASEEDPTFTMNDAARVDAPYLMAFDPLDGSSNLESNISVGSIFSVLPRPAGDITEQSFFQPGSAQLAAGYVMYGPATLLYLSIGKGCIAFTLDEKLNQDNQQPAEFVLSHTDFHIPELTEYAINHSNRRFWLPAIQQYIEDSEAGIEGPLGMNYNMRWVASMVAEASRILSRGGVFLYPRDNKDPSKAGRIRLLYEASPIAFLIEQAGGACTDGEQRMLDVIPTTLHQRIGVIFGSADEVEKIAGYHR
jgi:fructose-1,6-bisphosphatase I/sedoheptulose-1,7-bisphosphatase